ncbi:MAG: rhomboid family intramembrane serine protease [Myxococcota bacterium]
MERRRVVNLRQQWRDDAETNDRLLFTLIGINVAVFVAWNWAPPIVQLLMRGQFLVSAEAIAHYRLWTLLTYGFSHISAGHLIFNLLALWTFGRSVGEAHGWRALLHLYLVGAIAAGMGHVVYQLVTLDPSPALGASGAVMALAVVYAATFPERVLMFNFLVPVPAPILVGGYILLDVLGMIGGGGGTANAAHLAGAAYGLGWWAWRTRR